MIAIGNVRVDVAARRVRVGATEIALEPRQFDVLRLLASEPDTAVPRERLLEEGWPGRVVTDAALSQAMSKLRRALEAAGATGVTIATVHGYGYRLDTAVPPEAVAQPPEAAPAPPSGPEKEGAIQPPPRRRWHVALGLLLALALLVLALRPSGSPPAALAIAPFELEGDPIDWGRLGWPALVEDVLQARTGLRTVGPRRVASAEAALGTTVAASPDALLERMQALAGADHLLRVGVSRVGDEWLLRYQVTELGGRIAQGEVRGRGLGMLSQRLSAAVSSELDVAYEAGIRVRTLSEDDYVNEAFARGMEALLSGRADAATAHFSSALSSEPGLGWARYELANAQQQLGQWEAARGNYEQVAARAEAEGDLDLGGVAASGLGVLDWRQGRLGSAEERFEQALAQFRAVGNAANAASALGNLGILADNRQQFGLARERYLEALEGYLASGERFGESAVYSNLAVLERKLGRLDVAARYQQRAIAIQEAGRLDAMLVFSLAHAGKILMLQGEAETARGLIERALGLAREIGDRLNEAEALSALAELAYRDGRLGAMEGLLAPARTVYRELDNRSGLTRAQLLAGRRHLAIGEAARAGELAVRAAASARELGDRELEVSALLLQAEATPAQGRAPLDRALALAEETGNDALRARVRLARGRLVADGVAELEAAYTLTERTSDAALRAEVAARLGQRLLSTRGMGADVRGWLARAAAARPDHPEVLWLEALVHAATGDPRAARAALERARRRSGDRWDERRTRALEAMLLPDE